MAQTNYTPISLYYSTTASAVPTAANLVPGELAINTNDGKLYYEDSSGVVQVLATKSTGSIGGSNTQVQFNNSGSLGGSSSFTWDGTTVTATKFAGAFNGTVGATTASTGAFTTLSTSSTTTLSGLTASTALALDASKNVVSVTNTGTGNNVLSASPTLTGTIAGASLSLSSLTSGRVTYATTSGLLTDSANLKFNGTDLQLSAGNLYWDVSGTRYISNVGDSSSNINIQSRGYTTFSTGGATVGAGTEVMRITSSNTIYTASGVNVGIGTSSPSFLLDVEKSSDGIIGYFRRIGATINPALYITANETGNTVGFGTDYAGATSPAMTFTTSGTERMRIDSSGNVLIGKTSATANGGDLQVSSGITFPATQVAKSDANTLDDYEEGTWTPVATSATGSITSYSSEGKYTKVGNVVTVMGYFNLTTVGTASGILNFSALPFTANYSTGFIQPATPVRESNATGTIYFAFVNGGQTTGSIQNSTNGAIAWTNGNKYSFVVIYQTS